MSIKLTVTRWYYTHGVSCFSYIHYSIYSITQPPARHYSHSGQHGRDFALSPNKGMCCHCSRHMENRAPKNNQKQLMSTLIWPNLADSSTLNSIHKAIWSQVQHASNIPCWIWWPKSPHTRGTWAAQAPLFQGTITTVFVGRILMLKPPSKPWFQPWFLYVH